MFSVRMFQIANSYPYGMRLFSCSCAGRRTATVTHRSITQSMAAPMRSSRSPHHHQQQAGVCSWESQFQSSSARRFPRTRRLGWRCGGGAWRLKAGQSEEPGQGERRRLRPSCNVPWPSSYLPFCTPAQQLFMEIGVHQAFARG